MDCIFDCRHLGVWEWGVLGLLVGGVLGAFVIGIAMLLISINENLQFLRGKFSRRSE